ncbi:hypothetical protein NSK_005433 [Nannochloropsis salina CCMP1776]|uniref:Flavodoxin-like fold domain-containing protein n=1 Tax=Nannochloropsis salina CCMP1776 TaxID=1027361 RepID=A0A4D9CVE7_9STRA|nr:hypothetical protein NSK_005433 [Nannochloropsis salina CCMP1776]|eukprot:TFJ83271.1 hypothetical protein NSK_005433 [Nannochloropsis salina CCMP1776]
MKPLSDRHDEGTPDKAALLRYIDLLKWCDALIFVYPTWWYAMPAILKGWIDRTFLPHSAFTLPTPTSPPPSVVGLVPCLKNIKKVGVVTTYGSSYQVIRYVGDPGRRIIARGLRPLFDAQCTLLWLGMYSCDTASQAKREEFLAEVKAYMREF